MAIKTHEIRMTGMMIPSRHFEVVILCTVCRTGFVGARKQRAFGRARYSAASLSIAASASFSRRVLQFKITNSRSASLAFIEDGLHARSARAKALTWSEEVGFPDDRRLVFVVKFDHIVVGLREAIGQRGNEQIQEQKPVCRIILALRAALLAVGSAHTPKQLTTKKYNTAAGWTSVMTWNIMLFQFSPVRI